MPLSTQARLEGDRRLVMRVQTIPRMGRGGFRKSRRARILMFSRPLYLQAPFYGGDSLPTKQAVKKKPRVLGTAGRERQDFTLCLTGRQFVTRKRSERALKGRPQRGERLSSSLVPNGAGKLRGRSHDRRGFPHRCFPASHGDLCP